MFLPSLAGLEAMAMADLSWGHGVAFSHGRRRLRRQVFPDRLRGVALLGIIAVNAPPLGISVDGFTTASLRSPELGDCIRRCLRSGQVLPAVFVSFRL